MMGHSARAKGKGKHIEQSGRAQGSTAFVLAPAWRNWCKVFGGQRMAGADWLATANRIQTTLEGLNWIHLHWNLNGTPAVLCGCQGVLAEERGLRLSGVLVTGM
uniref:Uncharacterized protein n=1 Tax=Eutreptiella gymnastica TaxID=73025 RepID=A0A6T1WL44_9EUGL